MLKGESIKKPQGTLILEGGAMRGIFTAAVLDAFMERGYYFPEIASISAGTMQALCYLSRQRGRNCKVNLTYAADKRYMGVRHMLHGGSYFNFDFMFGELAHTLVPFDTETFMSAPERMMALVTDCESGKVRYVCNKGHSWEDYIKVCEASCSIPLFSSPVTIGRSRYVEGGVGMPLAPLPEELPFKTERPVYILTRDISYRKKRVGKLQHMILRTLLGDSLRRIADMMASIPERYNEKAEELIRREQRGEVFIIRPDKPVEVSRTEKDVNKLQALYDEGLRIGRERFDEMMRWIFHA